MNNSAFQVGILCALLTEYQAILATFDGPYKCFRAPQDPDIIYNIGRIGSYYAVAACLPKNRTGSAAASWLANRMTDAFPSLQHRFLVGIAGGVPNDDIDIRLGDIIIGTRIVQYDFGKTLPNGKFERTREPFRAPKIIQSVLTQLTLQGNDRARRQIDKIMSAMRERQSDLQTQWTYPGKDQDLLFAAEYDHMKPDNPRCERCDVGKIVHREARGSLLRMVYDGLIASADQVMRDGRSRDLLKSDLTEIRAVEMEAAGLEDYGFSVIRGICDYADSHKNKQWQPYAAAAAAAGTKALIMHIPEIGRYPDSFDSETPRRVTRRSTVPANHDVSPGIALGTKLQAFPVERPHPSSADSESPTDARQALFRPGDVHQRAQTFSVPGSTGDRSQKHSISIGGLCSEAVDRQGFLNNLRNESARVLPPTTSSSPTNAPSTLSLFETHYEVQLFSIPSVEYSVTFLDRPDNQDPTKHTVLRDRNSEMSLFQSVGDRYFEISRRLFLQSPEPTSLWLPFDRVMVLVLGQVVKLKFSDCKAKHSETWGGRVRYSATFDPQYPNVKISLTFPDDIHARGFADKVLSIKCAIDYHRTVDFTLQPMQSSQYTNFELYDCFEDRKKTGTPVDLLVIVTTYNSDHRKSEAFFFGPYLNFELAIPPGEHEVDFHQLRKIEYLSPSDTRACWPPHWVTENSEGKPQRIDLGTKPKINFCFVEETPYQTFMSAITGWQLKFTGDMKFRPYRRDMRPFFPGPWCKTQVTLWSKTSEAGATKCHILLNLCKVQYNANNWMSSILKAPERNIGTTRSSMVRDERDRTLVILKDVRVLEGAHVVRSTMLAGPANEDPGQPLNHQVFKFENVEVSEQFADILQKCIQAMNCTPMSS